MKLRIAVAALLIAGLSTTAEARPKKRHAKPAPQERSWSPFNSGASLADEARRWVGSNAAQMGVRRSLWCAAAVGKWLENTGRRGSGSDHASSYVNYGTRISGPQVGAIAVVKGRSHVGVVSGVDANGNPILISGNYGGRVAEAAYPARRIAAYVLP